MWAQALGSAVARARQGVIIFCKGATDVAQQVGEDRTMNRGDEQADATAQAALGGGVPAGDLVQLSLCCQRLLLLLLLWQMLLVPATLPYMALMLRLLSI